MDKLYQNIHQLIIEKCRKGDRKAQMELYKLYYKAMYNTSLRIVNNTADAEDIMQEAFLSAFEKLDSYDGNSSFGAWLKKITINKSLDHLKKKKLVLEEVSELKSIEIEDDGEPDFEYTVKKAEEIKAAIHELPDGYRIILSLYLLEGYDHEEISEILKISGSTSRSQLTRAKRKLIELISNKSELTPKYQI